MAMFEIKVAMVHVLREHKLIKCAKTEVRKGVAEGVPCRMSVLRNAKCCMSLSFICQHITCRIKECRPVKLKQRPCHPVEVRGQYPYTKVL